MDDNSPDVTETGRLEAFSDGVFAVAITLLALDLTVPHLVGGEHVAHLGEALLNQWTKYLAYLLSFITILIMWVNHHALFRIIRKSDHTFLLLNGALLLVISAVPFGTALLSDYLEHHDKQIAQGVYCGLQLLMALLFNLMLLYALPKGRLLGPEAQPHIVGSFIRQYAPGPILLGIALIVDIFSAEASLGLCIVLVIFFALPKNLLRSRKVGQV